MLAYLYSGTGNLLWVVEVAPNTKVFADDCFKNLALQLCQNQGDGLMLVSNAAPYHANFINPDGSDGVFCGNGVRCVAYHLAQKHQVTAPKIFMAGQTISCQVENQAVMIQLPKTGIEPLGPMTLQLEPDLILTGFRINMPNPHWVIFAKTSLAELETIGAKLNQHDQNQGGLNIEFVFQDEQSTWQALVYERGAGITKACGSGALAVLYILQEQALLAKGQELDLTMPGGPLQVQDLGSYLSLKGHVEYIKQQVI